MSGSGCDVLCVAPHTDDAELALGGTLALLAGRGRRVWIGDLTRGELATNAAPDERWREAMAAGEALGLAGRAQLALPDGFLAATETAQVTAVAWLLRSLRPRWLLVAPEPRRHPDHLATPPLVERAAFLAGLRALDPSAPPARSWPAGDLPRPAGPWRPELVAVTCLTGQHPDLVFDVSEAWDAKLAALGRYASQFRREAGRRDTVINDPDFLAAVADTGRAWGRRVGVDRAEALCTGAVPVLDDLPDGVWR